MRMKIQNRVGTTVSNLKILDWKREKSRTMIYVECLLCGKNKWLRADSVISERIKSCGCNSDSAHYPANDLIGKKFGRLTVRKKTAERDKSNGSVIWECECECGNIHKASTHDLERGGVSSCGCLRKELSSTKGKKLADVTRTYCIEGTNVRKLTAKIAKNNTSGYKGVTWDSSRRKWIAQIVFKNRHYHLGRYDRKEDAVKARREAENAMFGEFLEWYAVEYGKK